MLIMGILSSDSQRFIYLQLKDSVLLPKITQAHIHYKQIWGWVGGKSQQVVAVMQRKFH